MSSAAELRTGTHSARWGNWVVLVTECDGSWIAKVWRWPPSTHLSERVELAHDDGFRSARDAARWASARMQADGAIVLVLDAPHVRLEDVLGFCPAPIGTH